MEFVILGPTALYVDGQSRHLGTAKQRGMLAVLLYHVGEPVRVDAIVEHLWDGRSGTERRTSLYSLASRTRAVLHQAGLDDALARVPSIGGYRLDVDPDLIDFHRFRRTVGEARHAVRRQDHQAAAALLTEAIGLWRGEPLADLRGARSEQLRQHLNERLLDAQRLLADTWLRSGELESALALLEPLVHEQDLDEILAQHWLTALCAADRSNEARAFLLAFQRRFVKEMHLKPAVRLPETAAPTSSRSTPVAPAPRQLPKDVPDFVGHRGLLAEIDALLGPVDKRANVVVISGMPGVGKTSLAVRWGHRQRHRFPDGDLYLNANGYGPTSMVDPYDALGRFLRALDVPVDRVPSDEDQRRERFNQILADRRVLVVLDNIGDPEQARPLIPTADTCVTLITSRNRLTDLAIREGVRNITVPPLPEQDSLALLDQIVGLARTRAEAESTRELARIADGLPLALRVIGERVAERPRARITDLLDDLNKHLLDSEPVDGEINVHTVFGWSYRALIDDAARTFRLLGLHPGPTVTPESVAAMSGLSPQRSEHLLNTLARAHLITHDAAHRYRFHDLLRRFAADRAYAEETSAQRVESTHRLLDWYLLSAVNATELLAPHLPPVPDLPQPTGIQPKTFATEALALQWYEQERENLGAMTRWAAGHGRYQRSWQLPGTIHDALDRFGPQDDLVELMELALAAARIEGHREGEMGTLNNLGVAYFEMHDYARATEKLTAGLELARRAGFVEAEIPCLLNLAKIHLRIGDPAEAVGLCEHALAVCREMSNPEGESAALHRLGDAYRRMKQYDRALDYYGEALAIYDRVRSLRAKAATHSELATLYLDMGQLENAFEHCRMALEIHERTKDESARCDALTTMADIQRQLSRYHDAIRESEIAVAISESIADAYRRTRALTALGHALAAEGNDRAAERVFLEALRTLDSVTGPEAQPLRERIRVVRGSLD